MAVELGTAYVSILPDTSKIAPDMKKAFGGIDKEAAKAGEKAGGAFSGTFGKALKGAGIIAGAAVLAGVGMAVKGGWDTAMDIDGASRVLTGLYGDANVAGDALERVVRVSEGSSIDTSSYLEAAENFAYLGVEGEQLESILDNVGTMIVGTGGDASQLDSIGSALATAQNMGKVTLNEINQISKAGVPIFDMLMEHFGVTAEELTNLISSGAVDVTDLMHVMENPVGEWAEKTLAAGEEVEKGLGATWSRLKDNLTTSLAVGLTESGILDGLASALETVGNGLQGVVDWIFDSFVPAMQEMGEWIQRNKDWIGPLAAAIGGAATAWGLWVGAIKLWQGITKIATGIQVAFNAVMAANPIMLIVMAIAALVAGLIYFFTQTETGQKVWEALTEAFKVGWEWIKDAFAKAWDWISDIWDSLVESFNTVKDKAAEFWDKVVEVWDGIMDAFQTAWDFIQPILQGIWDFLVLLGQIIFAVLLMPWVLAWQALSAIVTWVWETILQPTWELIKLGLQAIGDFFVWVWNELIKPAWDALGEGIRWVWENVIKRVWDGLQISLNNLGLFFQWIWEAIIKPAWDALGNGIRWVWENVVRPAWDALKAALQAVGDFFSWVWNSIIKPAWDALGDGIRWVIDNVINPAFDILKGALDSVGGFFNTVVDGIKNAWDKLKGHVARPINFVIETVWNNGLRTAWNTIAGFLPGLSEMAPLSPVAFATGGAVSGPGTGTSDSILARLSHGEHVLTAAEVRALGGQQQVYAMREMIRKGVWPMGHGPENMPKFSEGGAVPGARLAPTPGEGGLEPIARLAKRLIHRIWPSITTIGGYRQDAFPEHPSGRALDVMVGVGNPIGDEVTSWALANHSIIPLIHALWKQTVWLPGGGTQSMPDRGDPTQNHFDHPHLWYQDVYRDPNVVPEGLVGHDGLTREDREGVIQNKIREIIEKTTDPLIEAISGVIGSPPPEFLDVPPKFMEKSRDALLDGSFALLEQIGDDLKDVYNAAREVKDIVVSRVTGLFRDNGGFIPTGKSVVTNETGKPEAVLNWEQLQSIIRLMESSAGMAALHRWAMGDIEAAMRHGVSRETIDAIGVMNLQLAEHMAETMRKAQETFFSSIHNDTLDFFGLSGLVGGIQEVWDAFHPTEEANSTAATTGRVSTSNVQGMGDYQVTSETVELETNMPDLDSGSPGSGPVVDQVKEAMESSGWHVGRQWDAVDFIVASESSWNPLAQNPTSTAFGLFQFLDSTWATVGAVKTENPKLQGEAGEAYIKQRYGDPLGAERFWRANRWYDNGGWLDTGLTLVRNNTGTPEAVLNPRQWADISRQTAAVADLVDGQGSRRGAPLVHIENLQARDEDEAMRSAMREARRASRSNSLIGGW